MSHYQDPMEMGGEPVRSRHPKLPQGLTATIALLVVSVVYWLWLENRDYLACIVICSIAVGAISGFRHGFLRVMGTLASIALACWATPQLAGPVEQQVANLVGTSGLLNRFLVMAVIGSALFLVATMIIAVLLYLIRKPTGKAGIGNWLGLGVGSLQVTALLLLIFGGLLTVEPMHNSALAQANDQEVAEQAAEDALAADGTDDQDAEIEEAEFQEAEFQEADELADDDSAADVASEDQSEASQQDSDVAEEAVEEQTAEEQVAEDQLAEDQVAEDQVAEEQVAEEHASEEQQLESTEQLAAAEQGVEPKAESILSDEVYSTFIQDLGATTDQVFRRTLESRLVPLIRVANPFTQIGQLDRFQNVGRTVGVLSNPAKLQTLFNSPGFNALKEDPKTKELIEEAFAAPEIKELVASEEGITTSKVVKILTSPVILRLFDEPKFVEQTKAVFNQESL